MRRTAIAFFSALLLAGIASAHQAPAAGFGRLSPDAPPETAQFGFLVGEWSCETRAMRPDGSLQDGPGATWTGYYVLGGWAIQDDWTSVGPDGKPFRGTNVRSFNPKSGKWDNRWLPSGSLQWKYFEAEQVGDTMVMTGGEGADSQGRRFVDRNTFYEIGERAWRWRKDRSFDGGETWIEGVAHIHCRAAASDGDDVAGLAPEARQFDFWLGRWDVNLRIKEDGEWPDSSVRAEAEIYSILRGKAVLELWDSEPIKGFSLRYYDPEREKWLLWLNWPRADRSGSSGLSGSFHHGRGDFYSERPTEDGGTLIARYSFNDITPRSLRWDDAYSTDGGETWRHRWRMEFTRTARRAELDPAGGDAHTYGEGGRCEAPEFRRFEALAGRRTGTLRRRDGDRWEEAPARLVGYRVLGGCAVLAILTSERDGRPFESFHQLTWNTEAAAFEETVLDSVPSSPMAVYFGPDAEGKLTFSRKSAFDEESVPGRRTWRLDDDRIGVVVEVAEGSDGWTKDAEMEFER